MHWRHYKRVFTDCVCSSEMNKMPLSMGICLSVCWRWTHIGMGTTHIGNDIQRVSVRRKEWRAWGGLYLDVTVFEGVFMTIFWRRDGELLCFCLERTKMCLFSDICFICYIRWALLLLFSFQYGFSVWPDWVFKWLTNEHLVVNSKL